MELNEYIIYEIMKLESDDSTSLINGISKLGNLKIDLSLEYRTHLFGIVNGAVFLDAGNIWNTSNVTSGDEVFKINTWSSKSFSGD